MKKMLLLFIIIFMFFLTGCWDKDELEDWGYVAVIGLDKGKDSNLEVTFQVTNPQVGTSINSNVPEPPRETVTFPAFNIVTVKDLTSTSETRRLTLTHAEALVVSEEFAKSDEFYREVCTLARNRDIRGDLRIIVSREKASEFINGNAPKLETRMQKFYNFMTKRWQDTGLVPNTTLHRFLQRTELGNGTFLAVYGTTISKGENKEAQQESDHIAGNVDTEGGNSTEMLGAAVFRNGSMIGRLNGEEVQLDMLIRSRHDLKATTMNVPDPLDKKHKVSISIVPSGNPKLKMDLSGDSPVINTMVSIKIKLVGIPSGIDYVTDKEKNKLLKSSIEEFLTEKGNQLIKKTQEEFRGESFLWGYEARKHFSTMEQLEKYNWMEKYPKAHVTLHFSIKEMDNGRILRPTNLNNRGH